MFENLNDDNFLIYAAKAYDSPNCVQSELKEDVARIRYIRRFIKSYKRTGELKDRNILNHIIIMLNVFGIHAVRMLFLKIDKEDHDVIKTFLVYLNYMPDVVKGIGGIDIISSNIPIDMVIATILRKV